MHSSKMFWKMERFLWLVKCWSNTHRFIVVRFDFSHYWSIGMALQPMFCTI